MVIYGVDLGGNIDHIIDGITFANNLGCRVVQIFVKPSSKKLDQYEKIKLLLKKYKMSCVVHSSYSINLATENDQYNVSNAQFIAEIILGDMIGAYGIVVHMGKRMLLEENRAINNMYSNLLYVNNKTKDLKIKILLETSSGQGTEMFYDIDSLLVFFSKFSNNKNEQIKDRFRICIDTCHIFAAGVNISDPKITEMTLEKIERIIGIKYIALIHLNDAKYPLNSHVDRHADLGTGYIGKKGLKFLINFFKKLNVPFVLETSGRILNVEIKEYLV